MSLSHRFFAATVVSLCLLSACAGAYIGVMLVLFAALAPGPASYQRVLALLAAPAVIGGCYCVFHGAASAWRDVLAGKRQ